MMHEQPHRAGRFRHSVDKVIEPSYPAVVVLAYLMHPIMRIDDHRRVLPRRHPVDCPFPQGFVIEQPASEGHCTKGDQSDKGVTDVGAGAGAQSRAADCHLVLRKHTEKGAYVLEAASRSFAPIDPLVLRWKLPLWIPDGQLDPTALDSAATRRQKKEDEKGRTAILKALKEGGEQTVSVLARKRLSMGENRCRRLLNSLIEERLVEAVEKNVSGNKTMVYRGVPRVPRGTPAGPARPVPPSPIKRRGREGRRVSGKEA